MLSLCISENPLEKNVSNVWRSTWGESYQQFIQILLNWLSKGLWDVYNITWCLVTGTREPEQALYRAVGNTHFRKTRWERKSAELRLCESKLSYQPVVQSSGSAPTKSQSSQDGLSGWNFDLVFYFLKENEA